MSPFPRDFVIGADRKIAYFSAKFEPAVMTQVIEDELKKIGGDRSNTAIIPKTIELEQNFPNPFNNNTRIQYQIGAPVHVQLLIYDSRGSLVKTLVNEKQTIGKFEVNWDGRNDNGEGIASGIYFVQIKTGKFQDTLKIAYIK